MTSTRPTPAPWALALALAFGSPLAQAQAAAAQGIDIAAQPLGPALNELARQTGLEMAVEPQAVAGKTAPAVRGSLTPAQALERLLAGSGLRGNIQGSAVVVAPGAAATGGGEATLSAVTVTASADASAAGLSPAYAGGQVARGGRVGILGTQDHMDTPFSVTSYTRELIQNQQARSVADVLQNDPTVRVARGFGNFQESYFIRGFIMKSDDIAYNGLYGLLPRQFISSQLFERVEVLRGASAFLNGATPGDAGIGGTINLLPKRAPNEPLSQLSLGASSGSHFDAAADVARRFGPDQSTGVRLNAAHSKGGSAVDDEDSRTDLLSLGVDWRGARARLSADVGYQTNKLQGVRPNVTLGSTLAALPSAPDNETNYAQPWTHSNATDVFGSLRGEYDFSDSVTGWLAAGAREGREDNTLATTNAVDAASGDAATYRFDNRRKEIAKTLEVGARGTFATGPVKHSVVGAFSYFGLQERNAVAMDFLNTLPTNLYRPVDHPVPGLDGAAFAGNDLAAPALRAATRLNSLALGDTLSMWDERLLLTLGLRHQTIRTTSYAWDTGSVEEAYDKSRTSPLGAIVFKLRPDLSLYANYTQGLSKGETAPSTANGAPVANAGQQLAPYVSKQKEVGLKYDAGRIGATLSVFTTKKPRGVIDDANVFVAQGHDRHQGIEVTAYGEPVRGVRVLGGLTLLDTKQQGTGDPATQGRRTIGVPRQQANVGVEWDVPALRRLTLDARAVMTGSSHADAANRLRAPGWTRLDVGARYVTEVQGRLLTLRGRINNVTDRDYWASTGGYPGNGYLVLGAPRTFALTATVDF